MSLTSRRHLQHPKLLTACTAVVWLFGCSSIINAILNANTYRDFLYASAPIIFATGLYAHTRYPTKLGWLIIVFFLLIPSIVGVISGLMSIYFDIGVKYSWETFINAMLVDIALLLSLFVFLYIAKIAETNP